MFSELNEPQVQAVFEKLRPFLGPTGQMLTDMAEALGELLASESSQKAYQVFSQLWIGKGAEAPDTLSTGNPAIPYYFLILFPLVAAAPTRTSNSTAPAAEKSE